MQYIKTTDWVAGTADVTKRLIDELSHGKKVVWLLSGGSNVQPAVQIMTAITDTLSVNLTVGLIDERFGPVGHSDSNWQQLILSGFTTKSATTVPVLVAGLDLADTAKAYAEQFLAMVRVSDIVIAQLGIGSDGHIAGILPNSVAAAEETAEVVGYMTEAYGRITMTPAAFKHIDVAYTFAFGDRKQLALTRLQQKNVTVAEQPAQLLKIIPEAYIYSDRVGVLV